MKVIWDDSTQFSLSEAAQDAYVDIARNPLAATGHAPGALAELRELGLITSGPDGSGVIAVDPKLVAQGLTARWRAQAASLDWQASTLERQLAPLAETYRQAGVQIDRSAGLERLEGHQAINSFIRTAVGNARVEALTAQPGGARSSASLEASLPHTLACLHRGVAVRTLYQSTARVSGATRQYVRAAMDAGAQIRTLDHYFERLMVFDRKVAVIPGDPSRTTALAITQPDLCGYLAESFEHMWDRAVEFLPTDPISATTEVVPGVRELIKDLLLAGYTGEVIARRVGLKTRAFQDHIAAIKAQMEVSTLVQLGYAIAVERSQAPGLRRPDPAGAPPEPVAEVEDEDGI
ncbi:hypothetical protein ACEZCY_17900 [Streptacidiphilus sp. N1-12]|uniref:LuxR family transcriptional regulator n=2 Tax=Streptacidiphilus alkalitolerans TaxID=3342712 RepID=A0ABV6WGD5_9ACTN